MQKNSEEWRTVPGYEGLYEVSNQGRVLSLPRNSTRGGIMNSVSNGSHLFVPLCRDGIKIREYVHRLVLLTFVGPCPSGRECRHLDGDPLNNSLSNLKWGTRKENCADTDRHGRFLYGERALSSKLKARQVRNIRAALAWGKTGKSLADKYGVSRATISLIKSGIIWARELNK